MTSIGIVGAGLVGRILAWRLNEHFTQQNQTVKITLVDEKDRNFIGTGLIAAAMVAPFTEAVNTEAVTQEWGIKSYNLWEKWLPDLEKQTHSTIAFNQKGSLVVAHAPDNAVFQRFHIKAKAVVANDKMQTLTHDDLTTFEPELAHNFSNGLYFPDEGVIDNQALYPALNHYFEQAENITVIENTHIDNLSHTGFIEPLNDSFDTVFDCRGNGAKADLKDFRSIRGEVARVHAPEVNFSHAVRLIHPRYPLYIAPRKNNEYIIGATQIESDDDSPVTVRSGLELLSALYSLHKGFSEAHILDLQVGLRPTFINNQPRVETDNKLIKINGFYRHGYLFIPTFINELIKEKYA